MPSTPSVLVSGLGELGMADDATHAWARAVEVRPELLRLLPYDRYGVSLEEVATEAIQIIHAEPRPAPIENLSKLWDIALALDDLPSDAGLAWRAVDAARHGDLEAARDLAFSGRCRSAVRGPWPPGGRGGRRIRVRPDAEHAELDLERIANGSFGATTR